MERRVLSEYLDDFLKSAEFDDDSLNGLQVEGRAEVNRLAVAVTACAEVFGAAAGWKADALLVHHGLFWRGAWPMRIQNILKDRLKTLFDAGISLYAYHLPLDAHGEVGNNAVAARDLGLVNIKPFGHYKGMVIGFKGRLEAPAARTEFIARVSEYYGRSPAVTVPAGPDPVATVGIVSGGAAREAEEAADEGLDLFVTGEPGEPQTYVCRERGLTFIAMGHYATERIGVKALAAHLERAHGLETRFFDVDNDA